MEKETTWIDAWIRWDRNSKEIIDDDELCADDEQEDRVPPTAEFSFEYRLPSTQNKDGTTNDLLLTLKGFPSESEQIWNSTGLTLWPSSHYLCEYLMDNYHKVLGGGGISVTEPACDSGTNPEEEVKSTDQRTRKRPPTCENRQIRAVELGSGLGRCGLLLHHILLAAGRRNSSVDCDSHSDSGDEVIRSHLYLTDGDTDTLAQLRDNVADNTTTTTNNNNSGSFRNNNSNNNSNNNGAPRERPSLKLAPRSKPVEGGARSSSSNIFGGAKARDEQAWEKSRQQQKEKEQEEKATAAARASANGADDKKVTKKDSNKGEDNSANRGGDDNKNNNKATGKQHRKESGEWETKDAVDAAKNSKHSSQQQRRPSGRGGAGGRGGKGGRGNQNRGGNNNTNGRGGDGNHRRNLARKQQQQQDKKNDSKKQSAPAEKVGVAKTNKNAKATEPPAANPEQKVTKNIFAAFMDDSDSD